MIDDYIKSILEMRKGISGTGALYGTIASDRVNDSGFVGLEPGDQAILDPTGEIVRSMSSPIAYDLWYLKHFKNLLSRNTDQEDTISESYLENQLDFLTDYLDGMKPLMIIKNIKDLIPPSYFNDPSIQAQWKEYSEYFMHLLAYEMWLSGDQEQFTSNGVTEYKFTPYRDSKGQTKYRMEQIEGMFNRDDYVGYFTFPAGQLGVQEVIAILKQHELEDGIDLTDDLKPIKESTCDFFFAPVDSYTGQNRCVGEHFFESGYVIPEDAIKNVEFLNTVPIPFEYYPDCAPQLWIRYWIHEDAKFPVPGEFIGILCRPMALPPHIWWFQETSPLVYAGNWMETDNLTSGIVQEVTLEAARTDGGIGNEYKIKVHGWNIYLYASDYMVYAVGDRVGILKAVSVFEDPSRSFYIYDKESNTFTGDPDRQAVSVGEAYITDPNKRAFTETPMVQGFSFKDMYAMEELDEDRKTYEYLVVPIEFYK